MPDPVEYFSSAPLTESELRTLRSFLRNLPDLEPILKSYQTGSNVFRFFTRIAVWVAAATGGLFAFIKFMQFMGWWPTNGGPTP